MFDIHAITLGVSHQDNRTPSKSDSITVPKIGGASLGQTASQFQNPQSPRQPTELEKAQARNLADRGLTGPPPAFQANILDVQSDIRYIIKQVEAARERARNQLAVAVEIANSNAAKSHETIIPANPYGWVMKP